MASALDGKKRLRKLRNGMLLFLLALLLLGMLFFWLGQNNQPAQPSVVSATPTQPGSSDPAGALQHIVGSDQAAPTSKQVAVEVTSEPETPKKPVRQGPDAGISVAPPSRDVTPSASHSPLRQSRPLERTEGRALPPPPERKPLPTLFRQVIITGPASLTLLHKKRQVRVRLAHVAPPKPDQSCWFVGQKAACDRFAATALKRFIRQRSVSCDFSESGNGKDPGADDDTLVSRCFLGIGAHRAQDSEPMPDAPSRNQDQDIAAWLVRFGWAVPDDGFYQAEFEEAKGQKRGMFAEGDSAVTSPSPVTEAGFVDKLDALAPGLTQTDEDVAGTDDDLTALTLIEEEEDQATEIDVSKDNDGATAQ